MTRLVQHSACNCCCRIDAIRAWGARVTVLPRSHGPSVLLTCTHAQKRQGRCPARTLLPQVRDQEVHHGCSQRQGSCGAQGGSCSARNGTCPGPGLGTPTQPLWKGWVLGCGAPLGHYAARYRHVLLRMCSGCDSASWWYAFEAYIVGMGRLYDYAGGLLLLVRAMPISEYMQLQAPALVCTLQRWALLIHANTQ